MTKLVIYDCDGVLFDSREAVLAYYDFISEKFDLPKINKNDVDQVNKAMMKTNTEIINMLTDSENKVKEILEFANNMSFKNFLGLMKPEKNLKETLQILQDKGLKMAVFTNRGHSLHYLLKHYEIDSFFSCKITSFDVENSKPHPEGIFKILDFFNVDEKDTIYIGDSSTDYFAAKKSGVPFLAFNNNLYEAPVISDHKDLIRYIT